MLCKFFLFVICCRLFYTNLLPGDIVYFHLVSVWHTTNNVYKLNVCILYDHNFAYFVFFLVCSEGVIFLFLLGLSQKWIYHLGENSTEPKLSVLHCRCAPSSVFSITNLCPWHMGCIYILANWIYNHSKLYCLVEQHIREIRNFPPVKWLWCYIYYF